MLALILLTTCCRLLSTKAWILCPSQKTVSQARHIPQATTNNGDDQFDFSELARRIETLRSSEGQEGEQFRELPVIAFDALLPGQKLEGSTSDPTFGRFLRSLGLGGQFCMTSINQSKRKVRRNGSLCRIEIMDARFDTERDPTAVDFVIAAFGRCRVVGPSENMRARIGRWRREYDPNGEEVLLGWGEERFVNVDPESNQYDAQDLTNKQHPEHDFEGQWSSSRVDCKPKDDRDIDDDDVQELIGTILPLLDEWETLAADVKTYENTDVVASARLMRGQPGLRVDPAALIRQVKMNLGDMPSDATGIAIWGAALTNPIPPLGISPEIRGRVLEAPTAKQRLQILEWGVKKSIANLKGTDPL